MKHRRVKKGENTEMRDKKFGIQLVEKNIFAREAGMRLSKKYQRH